MRYITVNCGSTNLRLSLYEDGARISSVKRTAGGRDTARTGDSGFLRASFRDALAEIIAGAGLRESDVDIVLVSGTITSSVGIYHIHHIPAPAGIDDTAAHSELVTLPDVSSVKMLFIPGIKTLAPPYVMPGTPEYIDGFDSMSGEECEIYGFMKLLGLGGEFVIALPGSYNKTLLVGPDGRISKMRTGMCGEFMTSVAENTLIGYTLPHPVIRRVIPEKLIEGFDYARSRGISPALSKSRMVATLCGYSPDETGCFFAGAALADDIAATESLCDERLPLVIGGASPLREVFGILLRHTGVATAGIVAVTDEENDEASSVGEFEVWKRFSGMR